ncbi:PTS sugar transporter subunit IIA [Amphibacillus cookii]|uniref:PTS sugar transporter subunit IIA n=1 Tax=Amphibacillus cookii TaxID=767787 RepID=UPI0019566349|nr:PTS sugar transporter subunit IIA [Amphibacillus cookii]MBM7539899.1 PTS system ascorbate-specific IIA component [Amphibacillus cookii]
MLTDVLPKEHMQQIEQIETWEAAIELASKPLLEAGYIEDAYVKNMIASVNKNGPYIVLMDYFALPHAKAGEGVNQLAMSLLKVNQPVDLKGNPVKVFMVLAAIDTDSHMQSLRDISRILADEVNYQCFISGDLDQVYQILQS